MSFLSPITSKITNILPAALNKTGKRAPVSRMEPDTFSIITGKTFLKKAQIKDKIGRPCEVSFVEEKFSTNSNVENIVAYVNGKNVGIMRLSYKENEAYIDSLKTAEHSERKFKGIGTEFLKIAVEKSMEKGHKGRVSILAAHTPSPALFYFKNNFRTRATLCNSGLYDAMMDYSVRTNNDVERFSKMMKTYYMELDEKGAQALLNGKRLYKNNSSGVIFKKMIDDNKTLIADWVHVQTDKFQEKGMIHILEQNKKGCFDSNIISDVLIKDTQTGKTMYVTKHPGMRYSTIQLEQIKMAAKMKARRHNIKNVHFDF